MARVGTAAFAASVLAVNPPASPSARPRACLPQALMAIIILACRHVLGYVYTSDPEVVRIMAAIALWAALFQVRAGGKGRGTGWPARGLRSAATGAHPHAAGGSACAASRLVRHVQSF